ncbi:D-2-hydroxyacid dehydrogenase [Virgibacillus kekensis]|uniref:D-2-hydroxyacid dehydrogenase n=1 Tax=Virgibacillus kekensis TaxID=202261 RepID=A0ABV9DEL7_9BACI
MDLIVLSSAKLSNKHRVKLTETYADVSFIFCENMDESKQYIDTAEVLITYGEDLTPELIGKAENMKWIMVISAGVEKMPFEAIQEKGILVTNARGIHKTPMAEYAISMLLQVYRQGKELMKDEAERNWKRTVRINEISGRTMLIVGAGAIGGEVARLAKAFNMKVYGISRSGTPREYFDENYTKSEMESVLSQADFVVSVLPSTTDTKGFFTYEHFQLMPDHAVFLNMGRGDAVSEEDILRAVNEQEIAHAVLDVFETEPLPEDHPFWEAENVTVTPHLSGKSSKYVTRALDIFEENLRTFLNEGGQYINQIDISRGY